MPEKKQLKLTQGTVHLLSGEETDTLVFKRPKAKHLRAFDKSDGNVDMIITMAADLTGCPVSSIEELDIEDFEEVTRIVGNFFNAG